MSITGFQRALVDLTLAPDAVRALRRGEVDALASYDLDMRDRRRLMEIARQPGMAMNCSLARGNRLELIVAALPLTCILLKPLLPGLLDELWARRRPDNYQLFGEEDAFADFIDGKIARCEIAVEYLPEIFKYEIVRQSLERRREASADETCVLEEIVEFQHSPDPLLAPLRRNAAPPPGLPGGEFGMRIRLSEAGFEERCVPLRQSALERRDQPRSRSNRP